MNEITVWMDNEEKVKKLEKKSEAKDQLITKRILEILEKFKPHMKAVDVKSLHCSLEDYFNLLNAVSEVNSLSLVVLDLPRKQKRRKVQLNKFGNLKTLVLDYSPEINQLLNAIEDNSLELLNIGSSDYHHVKISDETLQPFLNRQNRIKTLGISKENKIKIDHLALEKLTEYDWSDEDGDAWTALLEKQPELRFLKTQDATVASFATICQLRKLESLDVTLKFEEDFSSIEQLNNLQSLKELTLQDHHDSENDEIWSGSDFLGQVKLPNLRKLVMVFQGDLSPDLFIALSRGMEYLQHLEIYNDGCNILQSIIGNFKALKTLTIDRPISDGSNTAPLCQNETLEELTLLTSFHWHPLQPIYDSVNSCPNLKCFTFRGANLDASLVDCIQKHPRLTSFTCAYKSMLESLCPSSKPRDLESLVKLFEHFRSSSEFVEIAIEKVPGLEEQFVKALLGDDTTGSVHYSKGDLKIVKGSQKNLRRAL